MAPRPRVDTFHLVQEACVHGEPSHTNSLQTPHEKSAQPPSGLCRQAGLSAGSLLRGWFVNGLKCSPLSLEKEEQEMYYYFFHTTCRLPMCSFFHNILRVHASHYHFPRCVHSKSGESNFRKKRGEERKKRKQRMQTGVLDDNSGVSTLELE